MHGWDTFDPNTIQMFQDSKNTLFGPQPPRLHNPPLYLRRLSQGVSRGSYRESSHLFCMMWIAGGYGANAREIGLISI